LLGVDWRDAEADGARKPAGLAAGAKSEAMRGTARAPSSAPASPPAGAPSPANHLHPQAASPSGAGTDKGAGMGKSGSEDTADRLHSACIELVSSGQDQADTAFAGTTK